MRQARAILMGVAALLSVGVASTAYVPPFPPINVPVVTKYITTEVTTVDQGETLVLIGQLCQQSKGMAVNVSVLLNNNPGWDPTFGVLRYYIVDSPEKPASSALCTNVIGGVAGPSCIIKSWPSTNDMYIKGTAGGVAAISFTLDAEFYPKASVEAAKIRSSSLALPDPVPFDAPAARRLAPDQYLVEIVTIAVEQPLAYHRRALLNFTFCPTRTKSLFQVRAIVTGTDGQSSYALYLCDKMPCVVDGPSVIASNGRQLPSNSVTTSSGRWTHLYALIVCWGGVYDPAKDLYIGHFLFNGEIV